MTAALTASGPAVDPPAGPESALLAYVVVQCPTWGCTRYGLPVRVFLRRPHPCVVELPRLVCQPCGYDMVRIQQGDEMAKIGVHSGPSNAVVNPPTPDSPSTRVDPGDGQRPMADPPAPKLAAPSPAVTVTAGSGVAVEPPASVTTGSEAVVEFEVTGVETDPAKLNPPIVPDNSPDNTGPEIESAQASAPDSPDNPPAKKAARKRAPRKAGA